MGKNDYTTNSKHEYNDEANSYQFNCFRVGYLIQDVARMHSTLFDKRMKPEGITRSQWWVLANMYRHETNEGMSSTELANLLEVGKVTLGGLIDRLESQGFVERKPDLSDRRVKKVFITKSGLELIGRMRLLTEDLSKNVFGGLDSKQLAKFEDSLRMMRDNIRGML